MFVFVDMAMRTDCVDFLASYLPLIVLLHPEVTKSGKASE